jgi:hypothetical protein
VREVSELEEATEELEGRRSCRRAAEGGPAMTARDWKTSKRVGSSNRLRLSLGRSSSAFAVRIESLEAISRIDRDEGPSPSLSDCIPNSLRPDAGASELEPRTPEPKGVCRDEGGGVRDGRGSQAMGVNGLVDLLGDESADKGQQQTTA